MNNEYIYLRLLGIFILIFLFKTSFEQDTILKMKLRPISQFHLPHLTTFEKARIKKDEEIDSLNNSDICKKKQLEYKTLCEKNKENIQIMKKKVEGLNEQNKNSIYYYFIVFDCKPNYFDFEGCGSYMISSGDICDYFDLQIDKKEKSRIILDGPTGEVYYNEDIRRMPH